MRASLSLSSAFALALLGAATTARAAGPDATVEARAAFDEGLRLLDRQRWQPAAEAFERALALRPSAEIRYDLSTALAELGRVRDAVAQLDAVVTDASARRAVRRAAEARRRELAPLLGQLAVFGDVQGERAVLLDGEVVALAEGAANVTVDPGAHELRTRIGDRTTSNRTVIVTPGQRVEVHLLPDAVALPAPEPRPALSAAPEPAPPARDRARWWLWGGGAVLAASAVATATLLAARGDGSVQGSGGHFRVGGP